MNLLILWLALQIVTTFAYSIYLLAVGRFGDFMFTILVAILVAFVLVAIARAAGYQRVPRRRRAA